MRKYNYKWHIGRFCCEPIETIENFSLAEKDNFEGWHLHHRLEIRDGYSNSREDLMTMGLYYNRPASELIFLTAKDHTSLHVADHRRRSKMSEGIRKNSYKISKARKGVPWTPARREAHDRRYGVCSST